jgi:hypothetical protein
MKYAIIENGIVAGVMVSDAEHAAEQGWVECSDVSPGWAYVDGVFIKPIVEKPAAPIAPTKDQLLAELAALTEKIKALA